MEPSPKHLPGTESAAIVRTLSLREVRAGLSRLTATGGVVLVDGAPGLGKTFSTDLAVAQLGTEAYWIVMPNEPKGKETTARVNLALTGTMPSGRRTEFDLLEENVGLLEGRPVALVIDEAQHLPTGSLRQLRYLCDRQETQILLVLVGADVERCIQRRCPELYSRAEAIVRFQPLSGADALAFVREFHPLFAHTNPEVLHLLWQALGGSVRGWAKVLKASLGLRFTPALGLTADQAQAALVAVQGTHAGTVRQRPGTGAVPALAPRAA